MLAAFALLLAVNDEVSLRSAASRAGVVQLAAGVIEVDKPVMVASGVEIRGNSKGSTIVMSARFQGKALLAIDGVGGVRLTSFRIKGNRADMRSDKGLPPDDVPFADFYGDNGVLIRRCKDVSLTGIEFTRIRSFAVLANASAGLKLSGVRVEDSGTLGPKGVNNTTGGVLFEEGASSFEVRGSTFLRIAGNAIWTHSNYKSPRNADGLIIGNTITEVARDAIQAGHATRIRVEKNRGSAIGYPVAHVDPYANPVAVDTAGDVDKSIYIDNHFAEINGHCIDLDGFHDGEVRGNTCVNRKAIEAYPHLHGGIVMGNNNIDMTSEKVTIAGNTVEGFAYGGLFLIGSGHVVENNRFLDINRAHCTGDMTRARCNYAPEQPGLLRSGIYLGGNGGRPAKTEGNVIRGNVITGFGMDRWCVEAGPGVDLAKSTLAGNRCVATPARTQTAPRR